MHNDIYDRKPLKQWSVGRVSLLGDAAHPMTPNMGQGACQAIEDAIVLAKCLSQHGRTENTATTLQEYEAQRINHTGAVVNRSWSIGRVAQWENSLACRLRNAAVRLTPPQMQLKQLAPIVGHEV